MPFSGWRGGGWHFFPPNEQLQALKSLFVTLLPPDQVTEKRPAKTSHVKGLLKDRLFN